MVDRSDSILIDRPVEDVFAYVTDVGKDPAWHTDVLEAEKATPGPTGVGTTWHVKFKPSMGVSEGDMEVVAFEANRMQTMRGDLGPMHPTLTYRLEPTADGTRFTRHVQIKVSGPMKLLQPVMGMMVAKNNKAFLANLKRILESG